MKVRPFEIGGIPSPWREILDEEVRQLRERPDVLAIGIAGSWAQEDTWPHSDLDIEVLLKGKHDFSLSIREDESISVDVAFFGENLVGHLPYETRPIHDPAGVMTRELASKDLNEVLSEILRRDLDVCERLLERAEEALSVDPRATLVFLHLYAWNLSEAVTVAAGDKRTMVRRCSRMERAVKRHNREDLLEKLGWLYGFPETLHHAEELVTLLWEGYREVWPFFSDREQGPPYMVQQPNPEGWFRNRIEPLYHYDPRDFVWLVYLEFPDVAWHLFRTLTDHERLPLDMFDEAKDFPAAPRRWMSGHLRCLELLAPRSPEELLDVARDLWLDTRQLADERLHLR